MRISFAIGIIVLEHTQTHRTDLAGYQTHFLIVKRKR